MTPTGEETDRDLLGRLGRYRQRLIAQGRLSAADALDRVVAELRPPPPGDGRTGGKP